ncbi:heavy metal translocating P-type ATPase [Aurantiacibacter marinus]|uniref:Nitrogen fixation protein FixI n=1 Tax=Aurantiacibacter marinus TaxID=874156 RepID=A0A0H0XSY8_9SPHN|nr:heavy metal translocating P-type ATPase [Aurantiacibacter marinus]KLI65062.1 nitrogen fixation protein FixI [Aurantiacibacter marinus]
MTEHSRIELADADHLSDHRFTVPGMRCAGCISKIERELPKFAGIEAARVNFSAKRVAVRHDPALGEDAILRAFEKLGFEAQPAADNPLGQDDAESKKLVRAVAVAGFGMMNIMLLSVSVWSGATGVTREMFHWLSALIALPVIAYSGRPFFASALMALRYGRTNMDVPISIGVLLATALSIFETATGGEHAYFDGAVMLLFFLLTGRALDAAMRNKARSGISALLSHLGRGASVVNPDGTTRWIRAEDLEPDMVMVVAAGEALAADGRIISGTTTIDNSMLTGESRPQPAGPGMIVYAGASNLSDPITVELTATRDDMAIAEIARLMDEAGQSRSRYVRIADRAARLYAPAVHSLALLAFAGWMIAGAGWYQSLTIAIAVLIITCPCALGLAVPAAQVVASNALLKCGLLVKDGSALERLAQADIVLFDKTGTLTLGQPRPINLDELGADDRGIALALAQASRHPLSKGLAAALQSEGAAPAHLDQIAETAGIGVSGEWRGLPVALRRAPSGSDNPASELLVGERRVRLEFADQLRPDVTETLAKLEELGLSGQIVSGDREEVAASLGRDLGVPAIGAMLPGAKLERLEALKTQGHFPLMVGDGLNDGPALAAAHVSIAPGSASDVSQQAADAVFVGESLLPVAKAIRTARQTMRIVRQNFAFAIGYNVLAVPLALAGLVTPLVAAIAMSGSSIIVVANSLRLARSAR